MRPTFRLILVYVALFPLLFAIACTERAPKLESGPIGKVQQAVWVNGDFESSANGDSPPAGWTVTYYTNDAGVTGSTSVPPASFAALNLTAGGKKETFVVSGAAESQTDPDLGAGQPFRFPKYGTKGARVNYLSASENGKNKSANSLKQTMTVANGDVDALDGLVHVRFAVAPVLENPSHGYKEQPFYYIELANLTRGTKLYQDFNTAGQSGVPWKTTTSQLAPNNTVQWTNWQLVDVAPGPGALAIGDQVQLTVVASGCSRGGHFGRVYVDGMGSTVPGIYTWATGPQTGIAGDDITYTLYYSNGGATTANGAHLDMVTPPNTTYQSTTGTNCSTPNNNSAGTISCPLGNLAPGSSGSITVTVQTANGFLGTITNGNYSIGAVNQSTLLGAKVKTNVLKSSTRYADIRVTTAAAGAVINGGAYTYTITLNNDGPNNANAGQLSFVDNFPPQFVLTGWTCAASFLSSCTGAAGTTNINAKPTILSGGNVVYTVNGTITAGAATSMTNVATATMSVRPDPDTSNNTSVFVTSFGTPRTLTFGKTGTGTVSSLPAGVSCGTGCTAQSPIFANGTSVTLTASPTSTSTFTGWSGGTCSGSALTCTFTMDQARTVNAAFAALGAAGAATQIRVYAGSPQSARRNTQFSIPLTTWVTDAQGRSVNNVAVTYTVNAVGGAGASLSSGGDDNTNAAGIAELNATANGTAGTYTVTAAAAGVGTTVTFTLTNVGDPASVTYVSGGTVLDPNIAAVGSPFNSPLAVLVKDSNGNPVPSATVNYTVPGGASAVLSSATATTDTSGIASVTATANATIGSYNVTAAPTGITPVATFVMQNIAAAPASVFVVSGTPQHIAPSTAFENDLIVAVADAVGNALSGVTVTFAAPGAGASATLSSAGVVTTDATGVARVTATANATAGTYPVTASVVGVATPATFTLTNDGTNFIDVDSGGSQSATISTAFSSLVAVVTNATTGAAVSGVVVTFGAPAGAVPSATLPPPLTATTNAQGRATHAATANTVAGSYVVTATTPTSGGIANFALTNLAGPAASISVTSGNNQAALPSTDFPLALTVTVRDASSNPVPNATVTFAALGVTANAVLTGSPATTDSNGQAFVTAVANATTGSYNVSATTGAFTTQFTLFNAVCLTDAGCLGTQFCDTSTYTCATKLANNTAIPTIANHTPALTGVCALGVGAAVCATGVCSATDNKCGLPNNEGTCTGTPSVCRGGACSTSNVCMPTGGCAVALDCSAIANGTVGCTSNACSIASCNGGFTDCNTTVSDGCEKQTSADIANCGTCNNACVDANNAPACTAGICGTGTCDSGFKDCNNDPSDGCEKNSDTDIANCGTCNNACVDANNAPVCTAGICGTGTCDAGFKDCNNNPSDGCEKNSDTDIANCGTCDNACVDANNAPVCTAGICGTGTCDAGFKDCNNNPSDGCEKNSDTDIANCGTCNNACVDANNAPVCTAGICGTGTCDAGFKDCNNDPSDGCEKNSDTDIANCGTCNNACVDANNAPVCTAGTCGTGTCDAGYKDCNNDASDGCEKNSDTDIANCGTCNNACVDANNAPVCTAGICGTGTCDAGYTDCNNDPSDGCEKNTDADIANCGTCDNDCVDANNAPVCTAGVCAIGTCDAGYTDCNTDATDGCEKNTDADIANCGTCDNDCVDANNTPVCTAGVCATGTCDAGYTDCNTDATDGCEKNTDADIANCGTCDNDCVDANNTPVCTAGVCATGTCDAGYTDCNTDATDGCEKNTDADIANCGTCDNDCVDANNTPVCTAGVCATGTCDAGYTDCNTDATDGCEKNTDADIANCGTCDNDCVDANNTPVCTAGVCATGTCDAGYTDCNTDATDGCEKNTDADIANCGTCDNDCVDANNTPVCTAGVCATGTCDAGYTDCNTDATDGCEKNTDADIANCGTCDNDCVDANNTPVCTAGVCGTGTCDAGYTDCNTDASDGCEKNTDADIANCGTCDNDCVDANNTPVCTAGVCASGTCDAGYADCNTDASDGCEKNTDTDIANCGTCDNDCVDANNTPVCTAGVCATGTCDAGYKDCNTDATDGCEKNSNTDIANCGTCDNDCVDANNTPVCNSGTCELGTCDLGFGDCNTDESDGCEIQLNASDASHCGTCTTVCANDEFCASDTCTDKKANDAACASASECTSAICFIDDKCGRPNGQNCTLADECRGGACSATGKCMTIGGCQVDADCASTEFCDSVLSECVDKLVNGAAIPTLAGHDPELTGACTTDAGLAVCSSEVCDTSDNKCGFANGDGTCDGVNAATVCRSGVCGSDDKCGYTTGESGCTSATASAVCRTGICSALNHVCADAVGCAVDADCSNTDFCDTSVGACSPKLANAIAIPSIVNHDPALTSVCTAAVGSAVCVAGVCDTVDDKCGFANGDGSCTEASAAAVCRSGACGSDDKCGYPDGEGSCTSVTAGQLCRTGLCSPVSHVCIATSGCAVDGDCSSAQFCNTATKLCSAKLDNGLVIPTISGHTPALGGLCTAATGAVVCNSGVCDAGDDKCGFRNGEGTCTTANAGSVCRTGTCGGDGKCGFDDGEGSCTSVNAATRCRSGECDTEAGVCGVAAGCSDDEDCADTQYCDTDDGECVTKLDDGVQVPMTGDAATAGMCTEQTGKSVCKSGVCDERDNRCGFDNGGGACDETNAGKVCRSGACGGDGKCGFDDAEGECTSSNADTVCRSGMCSNGVCGAGAEIGCKDDDACGPSEFCNVGKHACTKKKADGKQCVDDNQCKSDSCNAESKVCNTCFGDTCGELKLSGGGCSVARTSTPGTDDHQSLLLIALSAIALALRTKRRPRARA